MRSRTVIAALLMSMLLQAVSLSGHWAATANPGESLHALLHWAGILHHHTHDDDDDDGPDVHQDVALDHAHTHDRGHLDAHDGATPDASHARHGLYQDRSLDSRHHLSLDVFVSVIALIPSMPVSPLMELEAPPPMSGPVIEPSDPFLHGPRRPPRASA